MTTVKVPTKFSNSEDTVMPTNNKLQERQQELSVIIESG